MPTEDSQSPKSDAPIRARHFRAPQGDGEALIEPGLSQVVSVRQRNRARLQAWSAGKFFPTHRADLQVWQEESKRQTVDAAINYSGAYRNVIQQPLNPLPPVILAGHQPELFHPGVWLKNFVLHEAARVSAGIAVNLIVDNDTCATASIRIPGGSPLSPAWEEILLDQPTDAIPFEERTVQSPQFLCNFPERLAARFPSAAWFQSSRNSELLANRLWRNISLAENCPLGESLARGRHRLEQNFGLQTLELPLSHIARTDLFRGFSVMLWEELGRLREIYNASLAEYRTVNRIRSSSHPVPALAAEGDWLEAPFWVWSTTQPRRQRLFIRQGRLPGGGLRMELSNRQQVYRLQGNPLQALRDLEQRGIKIRPRALITTMYARLFLSDLFIHGIGGAKYDELTDAIIRRFFGIEPPEYLTVTGTVRLPIARPTTTAADVRHTKQLIREIRFHPERFINDASPAIRESATGFANKKKELLREHQFHFRRATPEQFRALDDLNRQLSVLLTDVEIRLRNELKTRERETHDNRLLGSREFSFVLHPADELPEQLKRMAQGTHHAPS